MPKRTKPWPTGVPCWVDLTVPDVPAAQAFYSAVLGWDFAVDPDDPGGYVTARVDGAAVAGVGPIPQAGVPSAWTLYFATTDADGAAKAVTDAGGTMLLPPGDVGAFGRMFVAADPTGAVLGGWQAGEHVGVELYSEPGGLAWEDLRTPDPRTAWAFYTAVFGHETRPLEMAGPDYRTFHLPGDDAPLGGMGGMMGSADLPPHWLPYFGVTDTDAALAAAETAGGSRYAEPHDSPFGRMGYVRDPYGAVFVVMQADPSAPVPER